MANPIVAVVDTVFPTLDPAKEALSRVNAVVRLAEEPTPEKRLEVAADAEGVLTTYGQVTAEVIEGPR